MSLQHYWGIFFSWISCDFLKLTTVVPESQKALSVQCKHPSPSLTHSEVLGLFPILVWDN